MSRHIQFSKIVIASVMSTYFIAFLIAALVVMNASEQLSAFLIFVGSATSVAITAYSAKSGAENLAKIKRETEDETAENSDDHPRNRRGL